MIKTLVFVFLCLTRISVDSQKAFDFLGERLQKALETGEGDVQVEFKTGTYFFKERHIDLKGLYRPGRSVTLLCNGSSFIGEGPDYHLKPHALAFSADCKAPFNLQNGYWDLLNGVNVDFRAPLCQGLSRPEVYRSRDGLCRIRGDEPDLSEEEAAEVYIQLTQWYRSAIYKVRKIADGYIYFVSPKLTADGSPETDIDADYRFGKCLPRYALINSPQAKQEVSMRNGTVRAAKRMILHQSEACNFLTITGCSFAAFRLQDAHFCSNAEGTCLMKFYSVEGTSVAVQGCSFTGIRSNIVQVHRTVNFLFCNNTVTQAYRKGILMDYFTVGAEIRDNVFSDTGVAMDNDFCIETRGSCFWIHGNRFENFTYGAIAAGTHYRDRMPPSASGIIEENELYCTPSFLEEPARLLMDSGAIYTWTINKDVRIRNNYIHDIGGYGENRGIFCDDGTVNVHITGNRILRIRNYYCIDLRLCLSVEKDPASCISRVNVGNTLENNEVDGKVRFVNRD